MSHNQPFTQLTDAQWAIIQNSLSKIPFPKPRGKPRSDFRRIWNSILYVLIRGCKWIELPSGELYVPRTSAHRWLKRFQRMEVFHSVLLSLLKEADFRGLIDWDQLSVDGSFSSQTRRRTKRELRAQRQRCAHTCAD